MVLNKTLKLCMNICCLLILATLTVSAAPGLNVVLLNQNPDPVNPGNFVYLNVKVANVGTDVLDNVNIEFIEDSNFKIAKNDELVKELGTLSALSTDDDSNSFVVAKYKVLVDENTPSGLNTVEFNLITSQSTTKYEFEVLVQDSNPLIVVNDISTPQIKPGENAKFKLTLENKNSINLKDVKINLDLANVENKILSLNSGSNQKVMDNIKSGESVEIEYDIIVSPDAESKPYLVPVVLSYEDNLGNTFENTIYGTVKVFSEPEISLKLDSQEIYTLGKGKFSLAIANPGTSSVKGVIMTILPSEDYEIITGTNQYIGDMNPDDFQTLQGEVFINNAESAVLKVKLNYLDSYDKSQEIILDVPLKIYNEEELKQFGFTASSGGSNTFNYIIVIVLTAVITFFVVRRSFRKKLKKN